jgi:hypothetical protein
MDLITCVECERRFYVAGQAASIGRNCPDCGGRFALTVSHMASIPIDAHWLDPRVVPTFEVTVVELCQKQKHARKRGTQIVEGLADYFPVQANGSSVKVSVNRGAADEAALRVAAVLDGVDPSWEEHFYLPLTGTEREMSPNSAHLRLLGEADEQASRGRLA